MLYGNDYHLTGLGRLQALGKPIALNLIPCQAD